MAKKKLTSKAPNKQGRRGSGKQAIESVGEDVRIAQLMGNVAVRYGGVGGEEDMDEICAGFPIPCYSERYLRDSNVYITGKVEMYAGAQSSGKSAYGFHVGRQFMDNGGMFFLIETENKLSQASLRANIGRKYVESERFRFVPCGTMDMDTEGDEELAHLQSWMEAVNGIIRNIRELKLHQLPVYILVDSLLGASSSELRNEYDTDGIVRGRSTAAAARAATITNFFSNLVQDLRGTNITLGVTNHGKTKFSIGGPVYGDDRSIPGGTAVVFHCSLILWFERGSADRNAESAGRDVKISIFKNSFGDDGRKLRVGFDYDYMRDENGELVLDANNEYVRVINWDWYEATALLLQDHVCQENYRDGLTSASKRKTLEIHNKNKKFLCPEIDPETWFTATEFGIEFEKHPEIDKQLRSHPQMGVEQYPVVKYA